METQKITDILKAFAHPTRFMIVEECFRKEKCVLVRILREKTE